MASTRCVAAQELPRRACHPRYKYEVTPGTVERVKKRAMAKDANGEYVRLKCAAKVRKTSYRKRIDALLGSSEVKSISQMEAEDPHER